MSEPAFEWQYSECLRRLRLLGSRDEQNFTLGGCIVERHTYLHKDDSAQ